jgi:tetratricopeptide (TPR) repeat protein
MKSFPITIAAILFLGCAAFSAHAQDSKAADQMVDEGVKLYDAGKYPEAVEKYTEALKLDLNSLRADYEMGFTLYTMGKGMDAIPYLEKILQSNDSKYETYELLGTIYDDNKQPDKAIAYYKKGIAENPKYERLHFNLGLTYLRQKQYDIAEEQEIAAIKLDPKHASAQRIYAMAEYDKGNYTHSLVIWCSFLLLEPQTARSTEAFNYIRAIINQGITKKDDKHININLSGKEIGSEELMTRLGIIASTEAKEFEGKKESVIDSLTAEITAVLQGSAERNERDTSFYATYFARYFGQLANSNNMPAFCHLASFTTYKDENSAWFKENQKQLQDLSNWVQITPRSF